MQTEKTVEQGVVRMNVAFEMLLACKHNPECCLKEESRSNKYAGEFVPHRMTAELRNSTTLKITILAGRIAMERSLLYRVPNHPLSLSLCFADG